VFAPLACQAGNIRGLQVDLLYLHNAAESHLADDNKAEFMQKIRTAFRQLEEFRCVEACPWFHSRCPSSYERLSPSHQARALRARRRKEGRIRAYGMATWDSLRLAQEDARHISLQELVDIASAEGGVNHGFRHG